ncbi:MAG TPA: hypothetical protein VHV83_17610, partial [Armatimonadota bacterium]|nr:hypothetical protein [Armatimonadota bacterium]
DRGWKQIACMQRYDSPAGFPTPRAPIGWIRGHVHCLYSFLQAISENRQAEPSLQRGLHLQRILATAERSAAAHNWERLPGA